MAIIKVTKDGVSNNIVGSLEFAKTAFPDSTCEVVSKFELYNQFKKNTSGPFINNK